MLVSREVLVLFLAFVEREGEERTYTVKHALPDDVRCVDVIYKRGGLLALELESEAWEGQSEEPLCPVPEVTVHYHGPVERHEVLKAQLVGLSCDAKTLAERAQRVSLELSELSAKEG